MADINFGILDTQSPAKIGNAFIRTPEQQNANMLQAMQMQQLMDQREQAQYALGKSRREETGLLEFGNAIKALGPDPSPLAIAQVFMKHPNPEYQLKGFELQKQARADQGYRDLGPMGGAAVPRPAAAPAPGSFGENMLANRAGLPSFGDNQPAVNAGSFAPAAPRTRESRIAEIQPRLALLRPFTKDNPQAKSEYDMLVDEIKDLRKTHVMAPGSVLDIPGVDRVTAPQLPQQPRQVNLATDLLIPGPNGTMVPNQALIGVKTGLAEAVRPPRPEAAPRTQQVQMLDGTLGIMNMDTGAITASTMGGKPVQGKSTATGEKALTESQGNATAYGLRMKEAEAILEDLAKQGVLRGAMVEGVPFVGGAYAKALPSALGGTSQQEQQVNQAKSNFITAVLRKESGAVISDSEFAREDNKYFPQVNDGPAVIKQKANARRLAIEAMKFQAGPGAKEIDKYVPNEATGKTSATLSEPPPGAVRPRGSR